MKVLKQLVKRVSNQHRTNGLTNDKQGASAGGTKKSQNPSLASSGKCTYKPEETACYQSASV